MVLFALDDPEGDLCFFYEIHDLAGVPDEEFEGCLRPLAAEAPEPLGEKMLAKRRACGEAEHRLLFAPEIPEDFLEDGDLVERLLAVFIDKLALSRRGDALPRAFEELHPRLALEFGHLLAHARLGEVHLTRGAGHRAFFDRRAKSLQRPQLHHREDPSESPLFATPITPKL